MKTAKFTKIKWFDGRRKIYTIWLKITDIEWVLYNGPILKYRALGWEQHTTNLVLDSMKTALTLAGFEVINEA